MINNNYKNKTQQVLEYLFVIITVLQCNSVFFYMAGNFRAKINFIWQLLLLILFIYACMHSKNYIRYKLINFLVIFSLVMLIFLICEFIYYPIFSKLYILKLLIDPLLLIIYFTFYNNITNNFDSQSIFCKFENILLILAAISLPCWIFSMNNIAPNTSIPVYSWYQSGIVTPIPGYFDVYFIIRSYSNLFGINLLRNSSIFVEPSIFSYTLIIAVAIELFIRKNNHLINKRLILLFIVMFSTESTTGIVFIIIAFVYKFLMYKKNISLKWLSLFVLPILGIFLKHVISNKVNSNATFNLGSYAIRRDDMIAGLKAWKDHILFGNGLDNLTAISSHMSSWRFIIHNTGVSAGFTTILAGGGIILGMYYILPLILSFTVNHSTMGFAMCTLLPIIFVTSQDMYITFIIISYLWTRIILGRYYKLN